MPDRSVSSAENPAVKTEPGSGPDREEEVRLRAAYAKRKANIPADRYSSSNPGNRCIVQELEAQLRAALPGLSRQPLSARKILDIGCGTGYWLGKFLAWGASAQNLYGVDLLEERVAQARKLLPAAATVSPGNASRLNFPDGAFDLVLQFVVFSSVLDRATRRDIAREMCRVLKPGGHIIWYDFFFDNPWNPDVRGLRKKEIAGLFPEYLLHLQRVTVAPPLTRRMGRLAPILYPALAWVKLCSTHYLGVFQKS